MKAFVNTYRIRSADLKDKLLFKTFVQDNIKKNEPLMNYNTFARCTVWFLCPFDGGVLRCI